MSASTVLLFPSRAACAAAAIGLALALAGCMTPSAGPTTTTEPVASGSPSAEPSPTPTPTPTAEALTVPGCDVLATPADVSAITSSYVFLDDYSLTRVAREQDRAYLKRAMRDSDPGIGCSWGLPASEAGVFVAVGVLEPSGINSLNTDLSAAGYTQTLQGTLIVSETEFDTMVGTAAQTIMTTGDVWIYVFGGSLSESGQFAALMLDSMRTENPSAGL